MRTIKFRGRTIPFKENGFKYDGEWVFGFYHVDHNGNHFIIENKENGRMYPGVKVIPETVGQFAGLTDGNGDEIYEGDIIPYSGYFKNQNKTKSFNAVVVFTDYGKFELEFPNKNTSGNIWEYVIHNEVIGNIHDNPELINNSKP